jgi:2-dehydro-3-deoxyphosphogluconate aldolase/(4S)-4-hydroxy-2-oxoglutarate aldolase
MDKQAVLERIKDAGVVPVVRAESAEHVIRAAAALMEGGIPLVEITMTVPGAIQVIERCAAHFGDRLIVGVGSVTSAAMCSDAIAAGSAFVVSPTAKPEVIDVCNRSRRLVISGALTPTEILSAWEAGADVVKVFPAKAMGGPAYIRMIREPLPHIPLAPTGGVNLKTIPDYFAAGVVFVGAGGDLVDKNAVNSGETAAITARARQYAAAIAAARKPARGPGALGSGPEQVLNLKTEERPTS